MVAANCCRQPYGQPINVVGVVGIGHVSGIKEKWMTEESRDISQLLTIPLPHWSTRIFWTSIQWSIQGLITVGLYWLGKSGCKLVTRRLSIIF